MKAPLVARLDHHARVAGDRLALVDVDGAELDYGELQRRVRELASRLVAAGAGPEAVVALRLGRCASYVVALLATWTAGAAFVPIDPRLPSVRQSELLVRSRARLAVDGPESASRDGALTVTVLGDATPDATRDAVLGDSPRGSTESPSRVLDRLAYVIFTSGSTGVPKGVEVTHRGLGRLWEAQVEAFGLDATSRCLWMLSIAFDASVSDIGAALWAGASLHCAPELVRPSGPAVIQMLDRGHITSVDLPAVLLGVVDPADVPSALSSVIVGGEAVPVECARRWARRVRLINAYGPTEATVCSSLCICEAENWNEPLIGAPIPGTTFTIRSEDGCILDGAATGELWIGGQGVARGYRDSPALTERAFVVEGDERWYRTGDRVSRNGTGQIIFRGRVDRQVKIRGQRVEPGELETALARHPGVGRVAVIVRASAQGAGGNRLVAYVAPRVESLEIDSWDLRRRVVAALPRVLWPFRIIVCPALPETHSGKVDLQELERLPLEAPAGGPASDSMDRASRPIGKAHVKRWLQSTLCAQLGCESLPTDVSLEELGLDSLAFLELCARVRQAGLQLQPGEVPREATLDDLVRCVGEYPRSRVDISTEGLRHRVAQDLDSLKLPGADANVELFASGPGRQVLVTGGAGFLASRLIHELLLRSDVEITAVVRGSNTEIARARAREAVSRWGPLPEATIGRRLHVVVGDVARPRMGLDQSLWERLSLDVDTVVHAAARVHMTHDRDALWADNVTATARALELASVGRPKSLHHASTLSVFVASDRIRGVMTENDDLGATRWIHGGYAQTKWAAEWLLRSGAPAGLSVFHWRFGLITPDSRTFIAAPHDFLGAFVRGIARLGRVPAHRSEGMAVDVTPVDHAAATWAALMLRPGGPGRSTIHVANPHSLTLERLLGSIRRAGREVRDVDGAQWKAAALDASDDADVASTLLALCRCFPGDFEVQRPMDLFAATDVDFDLGRTTADLAALGMACPRVTDDEVDHLVEHYLCGLED